MLAPDTTRSPYRVIIDATGANLVRRSAGYKGLVIATVGLLIPIGIAAIVLGQWRLLIAWLLLPSLVLVFLAHDFRAIDAWRSEVLAAWCAGTLRLDLLATTLRQVPNLPRRTLDGMLSTLSPWTDAEIPLSSRPVFASLQAHVAHAAIVRRLVLAAAWTTAVVLLAVALWSASSKPLVGWIVPVLAVAGLRNVQRRGLSACCQAACAAAVENGLNAETMRLIIEARLIDADGNAAAPHD
jgi:hypothetical protein